MKGPGRRSAALWPRIPARFTAAVLEGHSVLGLALGALIHLVCLSGTLCVFVDELDLLEQPQPAASTTLRPGALDRAVDAALARKPGAAYLYALAPVTPRQRLRVSVGGEGWLADADGRVTPQRTPWTDFIARLHITLTAPAPWGALGVGISGAALVSLILSGVLAHPRIFRDAFRLRLSGSRRLREAELHNRLSVWGLPFHLTVSLTGAFFGLASFTAAAVTLGHPADSPYAPLFGPVVAPDPRPAPRPSLERLVAQARDAVPGSTLSLVGLERAGTRGARYAVEVALPGRLPRGEEVYFDAAGREIGRGRFLTGGPGMRTYGASAQLHFGFWGGLPVRIAYGLLGAALTYVCATGMTIWLHRRRDRGRAAPRLEALWSGWTWGAMGALALAAGLSRWWPPAPVFWTAALAWPLLHVVAVHGREVRLRPARDVSKA